MEQRLPLMTKKVWNYIRVMFFMLKKGISKAIFITHLNIIMKGGKLAGKSLHNLLFHHHHNWAAATFHHHRHPQTHHHHLSPGEYEFSCSDTPPYPLSLFTTRRNKQNKHHHLHHVPPPLDGSTDDVVINAAIMNAALEMLTKATASPGVWKSPVVVKQLRVTDSPFPLSNDDGDDGQVDEDAAKFITRFYNGLRGQN